MNLRESHEHPFAFDAFLAAVAVVGFLVAWRSFAAGGMWSALGVLALVGEALLAYGVFVEPRRIAVVRYREPLVPSPSVWMRIVFLSDLHAGSFRRATWFERIAHEAQALQPDVVILGGDYVADHADPVTELRPLADLRAPLGRFFVLGNHDFLDRPQDIRAAVSSFGFEDLTNRSVTVERSGRRVELHGVDDHWHGRPEPFVRPSPKFPHVTVAHEPDVLLDLSEGATDLVLSGHTHGGQVRLPAVGPLWPIPSALGRAVDRGRKVMHGIPCIISNGLGETDGRMRLFSPPEIVVVEIGI